MQVSYIAGGKYCRRCEYYFFTQRLFCECCGMRLRANPHRGRVYKEKVRAKKNELMEKVLVRRGVIIIFTTNQIIQTGITQTTELL
jgi:hypothetical protein